MSKQKMDGLFETNKIIRIAVCDIIPNPSQPRKYFEPEALFELSESIREYGILQPLTVRRRGRGYELVAGERRLRAAKKAGLTHVPCVILDVDPLDSSALALIENLHRSDLDFIEEAEAIHFLITSYALSQEEVAKKIGKSQSAVANKLRILRLGGELLFVLRENGLTERHARALLRLPSEEARIAALEQMIREKMNVAKAEEYVETLLSEEGENKRQEKKLSPVRSVYIIKDVRMFLNTITRGMNIMKKSGIEANYGQEETETDIVLTITIPKGATLPPVPASQERR